MKTILATLALFASIQASATTTDITVEGMHCSGCKKMITTKVCDDPAIKATTDKCEVKLTNTKKQLGQILLVAKPNQTVDLAHVEAQVKAAGDYKVTKKVTK